MIKLYRTIELSEIYIVPLFLYFYSRRLHRKSIVCKPIFVAIMVPTWFLKNGTPSSTDRTPKKPHGEYWFPKANSQSTPRVTFWEWSSGKQYAFYRQLDYYEPNLFIGYSPVRLHNQMQSKTWIWLFGVTFSIEHFDLDVLPVWYYLRSLRSQTHARKTVLILGKWKKNFGIPLKKPRFFKISENLRYVLICT